MRFLHGLTLTCVVLAAAASSASAQSNDLNAFGAYPAGISTGSASPYDIYGTGYYVERYGYPFTYTYQALPMYGPPPTSSGSYSSGYTGYTYPRTYTSSGGYGSSYSYPSSYSNRYAPSYSTSYRSPAYSYRRGNIIRGWRGSW